MMRIVCFFIVVSGFIGCTAHKKAVVDNDHPELQVDSQSLSYFREGSMLLYKDDAAAASRFQKAIRADERFVPAYFNQAVAFENLNQPQDAIKSLQGCLNVDPSNAQCLYALIRIYHSQNDEEAIKPLLLAKGSEEKDAVTPLVAQAIHAFLNNDFNAAEKSARKAIELQSENIEALYVMAKIYFAKKQYGAAKWVAKNAIELSPSHGGLWLLLGHTYAKLDMPADAMEAYMNAVKFQPTSEASRSFASMLLKRGRPLEALPIYERLLAQDKKDYRNYLNLGNAQMANKKYEQAKNSYEQVLNLAPEHKEAEFNLGLLFFDYKPESMSEMDRLKLSKSYFERYLQSSSLSKADKKEAEGYIKILNDKILKEEWSTAAEEPVEEVPKESVIEPAPNAEPTENAPEKE